MDWTTRLLSYAPIVICLLQITLYASAAEESVIRSSKIPITLNIGVPIEIDSKSIDDYLDDYSAEASRMLTQAVPKEGILIYGSHFPAAGWLIVRHRGGGDAEMCSGVLISKTRFLTAAHCVCAGLSTFEDCMREDAPNKQEAFIYFPAFGTRKGINIIVSTDYNDNTLEISSSNRNLGDLAIIEIDSPVNVSLPSMGKTSEVGAYVSVGFGTFSLLDKSAQRIGIPSGPYKEGIAVTSFPIISNCTEVIRPDVICSNYVSTVPVWSTAAGACAGDSGGPLFLLGPGGNYVLAGITSHRSSFGGDKCMPKDTIQTFYTDLLTYKDWIEANIGDRYSNVLYNAASDVNCKEVLIRSFSVERRLKFSPSPIRKNISLAAASTVDTLHGQTNVHINSEPKEACSRVWGRPGLLSCQQDSLSEFSVSVSGAGFVQVTTCIAH